MANIICPECKKEFSDTLKTCPHCGFIIKRKNKISKKKRLLLLSIALCAILLGSGVGGVVAYKNSPAVKIMGCIDSNNIKKATDLYENLKKNDANKLKKVDAKLISHFSDVVNEYANDGTKYELCEEYMSFIGSAISSSNIKETKNLLSDLKQSKDAFSSGLNFQDNEEYYSAVKWFSNVIKKDVENYEKAQEHLKECKEAYKADIIGKIDEIESSESPENDYKIIQKEIGECDWIVDDKEVSNKMASLLNKVTDSVITHAESLFMDKKYIKAVEYIDDYIPDEHANDSKVADEYNKIKQKVVSSTINSVDKKIKKEKYDEALSLIGSALKYDVNNTISDKREEVLKLQKSTIVTEFKNLLNNVTVKYDSVAKEYNVVKRGFTTDYINISNSVNVETRAKIYSDGSAMAYMVLGFVQSDWIFIDTITIASGDTRKTISVELGDRGSQVISGSIAEWVLSSQVCESEEEVSDLLSASGNVTVRFSGQGSRDHLVTDSEKASIRTIHKIVDMLNQYSYLKEYIK